MFSFAWVFGWLCVYRKRRAEPCDVFERDGYGFFNHRHNGYHNHRYNDHNYDNGTNHDNHLYPFRPGVFKIAEKCKVPIVVCTLQGTRDILKNGLKLKHTDVRLHLVDVIRPEDYAGKKTVEISDMVWELMKNDLDPEYQPIN